MNSVTPPSVLIGPLQSRGARLALWLVGNIEARNKNRFEYRFLVIDCITIPLGGARFRTFIERWRRKRGSTKQRRFYVSLFLRYFAVHFRPLARFRFVQDRLQKKRRVLAATLRSAFSSSLMSSPSSVSSDKPPLGQKTQSRSSISLIEPFLRRIASNGRSTLTAVFLIDQSAQSNRQRSQ